ncbi:MAG TPA: GAF domain-containing protein, partial [Candidatus Deferrimicrobium sp.]|nr:GAF domain-containing protein [Candidatus Deferrimicrobium sp.]
VKEIDDDLPVILMTGYASLDTAVEAVSRGAYDYLLKPVEFAYLELAVKRALDKRRSDLARLQLLEQLKLANFVLNRRISELDALYEAGKSIGSTANLRDLLRQIVALASSVTDAQVGSIMLLDERGRYLAIEAAIGLEQKIIDDTRLAVGESIAGYVAKTGEPLIVNDVEHDERFKRINQERYGAASLLCAPLSIKNKVIGVINMANKQGGTVFSADDLRLLTTFASQAAVAVDDANQFENNRRRLAEFEILHEVANELPHIQSVRDFRRILVDKLRRIFPIDYSIWFTWDRQQKTLLPDSAAGKMNIPLTDSGGIDLRRIQRESISVGSIDLQKMDLSDVVGLSMVVAEHFRQNEFLPTPRQAFMAIPVSRHGEPAYLFCLGAESEHAYGDDDISLARLVISQAALLFEKERSLLNSTRLLTMGNMISEISHDLRKPLTSIKGSLQILKQRWPDMADSEWVRLAEDEVYRMNELVRELVDFSNPNKYETEKVDLRDVVARAAELVGPDMHKSGVEFSAEFEDAHWEVIVNKNQILEALLNVYLNAVDAMPGGGSLTVHGYTERDDHRQTDYLALRISDTGSGIRQEYLGKIFERYYTTKETGTGLGLAVVERIISAHRGTIRVQSTEGQGTSFTLCLPYTRT